MCVCVRVCVYVCVSDKHTVGSVTEPFCPNNTALHGSSFKTLLILRSISGAESTQQSLVNGKELNRFLVFIILNV